MDNEKLGQAIDKVESLACGLNLPISAEMHLEQLKKALPKLVDELKEGFIEITGENPWE